MRALFAMADRGLVYRADKPVWWSCVERTALAEAELEHEERSGLALWLRFRARCGPLMGADLLAWTTSPWTVPASTALAFGPAVAYGLFEDGQGGRVVCALARAQAVGLAVGTTLAWVRDVGADELSATRVAHPLAGVEGAWLLDLPVVPASHPDDATGSGLVHTAPAHGPEDAEVGRRHGLAMHNVVDEDGRMASVVPRFGGLEVVRQDGSEGHANAAVAEALAEAGTLWARGSARRSVALSWRSKAPTLYRATPQWFVAMVVPMVGNDAAAGNTLRAAALGASALVRVCVRVP